jgi:hypothetical protein
VLLPDPRFDEIDGMDGLAFELALVDLLELREWEIELWDRKVLAEFVEGEAPAVDPSVCAECGKTVTKGVSDWCLARPWRYGGAVFCRAHQARSARAAA